MIRSTAAFTLATALATGLATAPVQAFDLTAMSPEERAAFQLEVRAYLMENPQVIMDAVAVLEQRQAEAQVATDSELVKVNAADLFEDKASWVGGNLEGDITMVEFVDYRCGYCRKAHDEVAELLKSDGNIKLIVKELPILGDASVISSRFAIATRIVAGDDAYKAVSDVMIKLKSGVEPAVLEAIATKLNLDSQAILAKMNSDEVSAIIGENRQLAARLNISGTPTFIMQDQVLRGYMPLDNMQSIVASLRDQ